MLKMLLGCRSVEKVLFFLLVNEKCYAHQLHRTLQTSLTPIQKALNRLENGSVLMSYQEGKQRIYQFNPDYPLLSELEFLLNKAFSLLPIQDKKSYYYMKQPSHREKKERLELLQCIWNQLKHVSNVSLIAKSHIKSTNYWQRKGMGHVSVKQEGERSLIFIEQGSWSGEQEQTHNYYNSFRWTWNPHELMLSLEHLRRGEHQPVFLFHLAPNDTYDLQSLHSHQCGEDSYFGWLKYSPLFLQLKFKTMGPKKNEEIECIYT
jgi:hypothetical protein